MSTDENRLEGLTKDISVIKSAIRANSGFLRHILAAPVMGGVGIAIGLLAIVLPLAWEIAGRRYGTIGAAPPGVIIILISVTVLAVIAVGIWKNAALRRAARNVDSRYTLLTLFDELAEHPAVHAQGAVVLLATVLAVVAGRAGAGNLVLAAIAGGIGTTFMLYTVAFLLKEYMLAALWLYAVTVAAVLLPAVSALVLTAAGIGPGFIIFGVLCNRAKREADRS